MVLFKFLVVGVVLTVAVDAEVAKSTPCEDLTTNSKCSVGQVRVDPCKQAPRPCVLKTGKQAQMDFDFIPDFSASKLKTAAYWTSGAIEHHFTGFGSDDACLYTTCPTIAGQQQLFNYTLTVAKKLPSGIFNFKWKVWNEDNAEEDVCCFRTSVNLR